jgi:hypothetical protein
METRIPSNVDAMPLAGAYWFTDFPGAEPVRVDVAIEFGQVLVRFPPLDGDEGAELLLKDMAACADWKQHFRRIR